jgi:hypothetical protein
MARTPFRYIHDEDAFAVRSAARTSGLLLQLAFTYDACPPRPHVPSMAVQLDHS